MQPSQPAEKANVSSADLRRAAWTCSLGSALEYYDFALYSLASAIIFGPLFFPNQEPGMALIASFGTYFLGFAVRPVGGIIFGSLGDRLGRKFVLLATVLLMGIASTLMGFYPLTKQRESGRQLCLLHYACCKGLVLGLNRREPPY